MMKRLKHFLIDKGPSDVLTMILGPSFIAYGAGLMQGYRSSLLVILGLPPWAYATMFIVAGVVKLAALAMGYGRFSHAVGVTVCTFWASIILVFAPSVAGWVGALPWITLAVITLMGAVWPDKPIVAAVVIKPLSPEQLDNTNPAMRAIDYLKRHEERIDEHADSS